MEMLQTVCCAGALCVNPDDRLRWRVCWHSRRVREGDEEDRYGDGAFGLSLVVQGFDLSTEREEREVEEIKEGR